MFKKFLQFIGVIRADYDALVAQYSGAADVFEAHAARSLSDANDHYDESERIAHLGDLAHVESVKATKVAANFRQLFATE